MPARKTTAVSLVSSDEIGLVKRVLLNRLYGREPLPRLVGLDAPLDAVYSLLKRTVSSSEGNSALLIGPRGSGKSSIVQRSLKMLQTSLCAQSTAAPKYHIVRLNGFVHTNDKIALRDIARQLLINQELENILIGSFADAFTYILNLLRDAELTESIPPVLFILEEFDLLAQHPKQSLLYTLFDIAQSQQTPIAVLGVTARIDVMDLLEKRVKSRFSHRQIFAYSPKSLEEFTEIAQVALYVDSEEQQIPSEFAEQFNDRVDKILSTDHVASFISDIFEFGKDVRQLLRVFAHATSKLSPSQPLLELVHVQTATAQETLSAKMQVLSSISLLEICLIISMKSLIQGGSGKFNFEMIYNEYKTFMSRHLMAAGSGGAMKVYKKPVALKAFETLVGLEIVRPVLSSVSGAEGGVGVQGRNDLLAGSAQTTRSPKEYRMVQLMLEPGQVNELISKRLDIPAVIRRWAQQ